MFTGIVQRIGRVQAIEPRGFGSRLVIDPRGLPGPIEAGDSVCVGGVCLTVAEPPDRDVLSFDVVRETLSKTSLGRLSAGGGVNLERSLTPSQSMGGHFVQGHVDGLAEVAAIQDDPKDWRVTLRPPAELMAYAIPKGSVTLDGVSLTIAAVHAEAFDVALIPTTLEHTTLDAWAVGDLANIEADILAKTVVHTLQRMRDRDDQAPPVDHGLLEAAGFLDH